MADKDGRLSGAKVLGLPTSRKDKLGGNDLNDLYRFNIAARSSFSADVSGIKPGANIDVELYSFTSPVSQVLKKIGKIDFKALKAKDRRGRIQVVAASRAPKNKNESIQISDLAAGDYFIRVYDRTGSSKYTLTLNSTAIVATPTPTPGIPSPAPGVPSPSPTPGTPSPTPTPGTPSPTPTPTPLPGDSAETAFSADIPTTATLIGTLSNSDPVDYYKFTPTDSGDYLFDFTGDGTVNILGSDGSTPLKASTSSSGSKFIEPLQQGNLYYIKLSKGTSSSTNYSLSVGSKLTDNASNTASGATPLTLTTTPTTRTGYVVDQGIDSPDDYYSFNVAQTSYLTANLTGLFGNLDIQLYDKNKTPAQGLVSSRSGSQAESFSGTLAAGDYYIHVLPGASTEGSTYSLSLTLASSNGVPSIARDVNPYSTNDPNISNLTNVNGIAYFGATDDQGTALWRSDGTLDGTKKIKSFNSIGGSTKSFANVNGTLYFAADGGAGTELWKSDGTTAGTVQVADINPGSSSSSPNQLTVVGNTLYFLAAPVDGDTELFRTSTTGVQALTTLSDSDLSHVVGSQIKNLTGASDTLYFTGKDGVQTGNSGTELWSISNSSSTPLVANLNTAAGTGSNPTNLTLVNGSTLFVSAVVTGTTIRQLVRIDNFSTAAYTTFNPNNGDSASPAVSNLVANGSTVYFVAKTAAAGTQLWEVTNAATAASDMNKVQLTNNANNDATPTNLVASGSNLYFFASDDAGTTQLYKTDGTMAGTTPITTYSASDALPANPTNLVASGGMVYFVANDSVKGIELWHSDGTTATFDDINQNNGGSGSSSPTQLTDVNGRLFFVADAGNGNELWTV